MCEPVALGIADSMRRTDVHVLRRERLDEANHCEQGSNKGGEREAHSDYGDGVIIALEIPCRRTHYE